MANPFNIANMGEFLYYIMGVEDDDMSDKIRAEGYNNMEALLKRDKKWVTQLRTRINKSTTGTPESKDMTTQHEESLWKAVVWAKYTYITQRDLDYNLATFDAIEMVYEWYDELEEELSDTTVATFTSKLNKRTWFESIDTYLGAKKGKHGFVNLSLNPCNPRERSTQI